MFAFCLDVVALIVLVPFLNIVGAALSTIIACFVGLILLIIAYNNYTSTSNIIKTIVAFAGFGFFIYLIPHSSRVWTLVDLGVSGMVYLVALLVLGANEVSDYEIGLVREEDLRIILSGYCQRIL